MNQTLITTPNGKYKRMNCRLCDKIYFISYGAKSRNMQQNIRRRDALTCSPKCSRDYYIKLNSPRAYKKVILITNNKESSR